ncbi:Sugar transport protein 13 [Apostasia shenzhenica]|uniref:Sugar transport protein 13 n=1 Tax=Apostasia shenzhenica TaxID=1088818 RepID=A0A2I0AQK5_9ASPA|nr:Sugar transport protein 13 [Apostasia shenzhenica]
MITIDLVQKVLQPSLAWVYLFFLVSVTKYFCDLGFPALLAGLHCNTYSSTWFSLPSSIAIFLGRWNISIQQKAATMAEAAISQAEASATAATDSAAVAAVDDDAKFTFYIAICSTLAATGGLLFGYDIGISGGVTAMDGFLEKFFHRVHRRQQAVKEDQEDNYCRYDDQELQLFTSSLYLACLVGSIVGSRTCSKYGRKLAIQLASIFYLVGAATNASAYDLSMLILGRILVGMGDGFVLQAVPLFLSELAPAKIRGSLNILFQLNVTVGILIAKTVNYFAAQIYPWGWRLSLGLAEALAIVLFLGSLVITETPTSLVERGHHQRGLAVLEKIRGTSNVRCEYKQIILAGEASRQVKDPYRSLLSRSCRPPLAVAVAVQIFTQFTGINVIMFYAPLLFETIGFKTSASLLSTVIVGGINAIATVVSIALVDRAGRRVLLMEASVQMFVTQAAIGGILAAKLTASSSLETGTAVAVVVLICLYVMSFAWSWGAFCCLIPSEIFPLESRTAGISCSMGINMICTFIIAQAFLSMLCRMRAGTFFFFAGWTVVMGLFVLFLLPETNGVPIDDMSERVWKQHWFWKSFMDDDQDPEAGNHEK